MDLLELTKAYVKQRGTLIMDDRRHAAMKVFSEVHRAPRHESACNAIDALDFALDLLNAKDRENAQLKAELSNEQHLSAGLGKVVQSQRGELEQKANALLSGIERKILLKAFEHGSRVVGYSVGTPLHEISGSLVERGYLTLLSTDETLARFLLTEAGVRAISSILEVK